ncbi:MAG: mevalonate kinase, partial [Microbacteriaceae bacterium]
LQGVGGTDPAADLPTPGADFGAPGADSVQDDNTGPEPATARPTHAGYGKIILLGEHSVVYGRHAIAAPIGLSIRAQIAPQEHGIELVVAGVEADPAVDLSQRVAALVVRRLGVADSGMRIEVFPELPRANGLGASAALAVAVIRAVADRFQLSIDDQEVSALAFECERIVHGTPSGVDNTVATFGRTVLFRKRDGLATPETSEIVTAHPIPVVIGLTGVRSLTAQTVGLVRSAWQRHPQRYESIFDQIDELVLAGVQALRDGDIAQLGDLMNINQGMLAALQVSSPELESLVGIARRAGALGAKLTGGGGGGAMIAIAEPDGMAPITAALQQAGYSTYLTEIR